MNARRVLLVTVVFSSACASPEARRVLGGGAGADIGNHGATVVLHGGAGPYYRTPCVTQVECAGPRPLSIRAWRAE